METDHAVEYYKNRGINEGSKDMRELFEYAKKIQPLSLYHKIPQTPLLMINGQEDELTSKDGAKTLYQLLHPLYDNKEDLQFSLYEKKGHNRTEEMDQEMYKWIKKYLIGDN